MHARQVQSNQPTAIPHARTCCRIPLNHLCSQGTGDTAQAGKSTGRVSVLPLLGRNSIATSWSFSAVAHGHTWCLGVARAAFNMEMIPHRNSPNTFATLWRARCESRSPRIIHLGA